MNSLGVFIKGIFIADQFKPSNDPSKPGTWRISLQIEMQSFVITMDNWESSAHTVGDILLVKVTPWSFNGRTGYSHGVVIPEA